MPAKQNKKALQLDAIRHEDSRANIPTSELRDFVGDDESRPPSLLYPRDPSLDPQLVWNGKDEQNRADLEVLAVPIYIQEKIQPQAIIEELRRAEKSSSPSALPSLYEDFNGIEFKDLIEFYQHRQHWQNRMILGDSLMVMASLAEKEGLKGKVQMIYFDPPYGIRFGSNWQLSTRKTKVTDGREDDLARQPEQIRAFRDTWEKGIHSYLNYLRDRLLLARELLSESGSIFLQISDENVHLVRSLMDEVFGSENYCRQISFTKTTGQTDKLISSVSDYLIWYAKDKSVVKFKPLYLNKIAGEGGGTRYVKEDEFTGKLYSDGDLRSQSGGDTINFSFNYQNRNFLPHPMFWKTTFQGMSRLAKANRLFIQGKTLRYKRFLVDFPASPLTNNWTDVGGIQSRTDPKIYVVQTTNKVVQRCMLMTTDPGDLVLDPTCGSGTTAYVAEQWGRRWITIDTARVAITLARTRLMAARFPSYLLADSPEGASKEHELSGKFPSSDSYQHDIKAGFVYERVPHITLRDIANNETIDQIHESWQPQLDAMRTAMNQALQANWEEWEIPRELPQESAEIRQLLADYWESHRQRQVEIDTSIKQNSAYEILYDRPYLDKRKLRVTGAFTVESLSPHRTLEASTAGSSSDYVQIIIDNLRKAGVQNSYRHERLVFDTLNAYAGKWLHAVGSYTDAEGNQRRVAVSIGSEHGTVGRQQIREAAKEALNTYDLLLLCGFAFEAGASEESKRFANLNLQIVRMNSDLMIGSALKKTDRANLFTIFGEPDIEILKQADGRYILDIRGLDIYDPTSGQIRSSSTDDIACWFIDTAYNEEAFFVRHAYFLGQEDAYDNLKKALRSEIDEEAWQMLYSRRSMPFECPENRRIAVKVINHYGDEVLKVYSL